MFRYTIFETVYSSFPSCTEFIWMNCSVQAKIHSAKSPQCRTGYKDFAKMQITHRH